MKYAIIPVTPFMQNCSLLVCETTRHAALVDPGGDVDRILAAVDKAGVTLEKIFLTHGHLDHAGGAGTIAHRLGIPIEGPQRAEAALIQSLPEQGRRFGLGFSGDAFEPDRWLEQGDVVSFGAQTLEVSHCPGHTPGHVIYFHREDKMAWVGDVLFAGSVGRTDLPGGDHRALIRSIREKLWPLGDDVEFVSGHGPNSTFGRERKINPFVADHLF
ncbi:MBL fold metallo-hydrolase [Denitratisoma sp. DHT3]|uniref:MBL fold metallo-hydrolase n=1 Tax=Denitratisoma sp. DHT3 TaxID=1981880 RepID=UPI001198B7D2|nr:MBL fold metallo-hydrolase [Denitratisoma sp. DHT3]QDX81941.1 MBL fold metallo-hydrolase [Denitratisoma sp. DHT3]